MDEKITKVTSGTRCTREVRLDKAGKPVYCPSNAVMAIGGKPFCQAHAHEQMLVIEAKKSAI
jgi:hypothetical protein